MHREDENSKYDPFILAFILSATDVLNDTTQSFYLYCLTFGTMTIVETVLNISISTEIQSNIDVAYSGRFGGITAILFVGLTPLGQLFYGYLFQALPIYLPFLLSGLMYVIIAWGYKWSGRKNVSN